MKLPRDPDGPLVPGGYVHLTRQIYESSLWTMAPYCRVVAITCLAMANYQDKKWFDSYEQKEVIIKRGSFITSVRNLADHCKISQSLVPGALRKLQQHGFLKVTVKKNSYTLITVIKYDYYNDPKSYLKQGLIGGVGTPTGTDDGTEAGTRTGEQAGTRTGTNLISKEVKKERRGGPPEDDRQNSSFFLASQFRQYISKSVGAEKCQTEFADALKRGLDPGALNKAIESQWKEGMKVWDWIKEFEKDHRHKESRPKPFRASDEPQSREYPPEIKKMLSEAMAKLRLKGKPDVSKPSASGPTS